MSEPKKDCPLCDAHSGGVIVLRIRLNGGTRLDSYYYSLPALRHFAHIGNRMLPIRLDGGAEIVLEYSGAEEMIG